MVLTAVAGAAAIAGAGLGAAGDTTRVSVANDGAEAALGGFRGATSGTGRYVVFASGSTLTAAPAGGKVQLYVRDRAAGTTHLASASAAGAAATADVEFGDAADPPFAVTPDGRYVAFATRAGNLVAGDDATSLDVFRKDLRTGDVVLASQNSAAARPNADVGGNPSISADGSRVVFTTGAATNLVPGGDANGAAGDVVLRDVAAGTTTLVSANTAGVQANDFTERPSISADGRVVAFEAGPNTTNFYAGDVDAGNGGTNDIIVKNLATGVATPAAVVDGAAVTATNIKGGNFPDLSGDGRYVVFQTSAALVGGDANNQNDSYRRDMTAARTDLASAGDGVDTPGGAGGTAPRVSADGARVAFTSGSTNLVSGDNNAQADAFVRTVATKATARASVTTAGAEVPVGAETAGVSGNGGVAVFTGQGTYTSEAAGPDDDVFARELAPTDAQAPTVTVSAVNAVDQARARVTGTVAADPSGIGTLTVAGVAVRPAADGGFSQEVALAPGGSVDVVATDGAGNAATVAAARAAAPSTGAPAPRTGGPLIPVPRVALRVVGTRVRVARRTVTVTFRASGTRSLVALQRRVVRRRAVRFVTVQSRRPRVARALRPVRVVFRRPAAGRYRVRVRVWSGRASRVTVRGFVAPRRR